MKLKTKKAVDDAILKTVKFNPEIDKGLTNDQVKQRKSEGLFNTQKKRTTKTVGKMFFDNLLNPLNVILIIIFVLMITAKLPITSFFFIVILASNSILGLIQDFNARRLVSKLSIMTEQKTFVLRNGEKELIATEDIVYEDIIFLSTGDQIPTDCTIVEGKCSVNESMLTGESLPINKIPTDILYSGSYIVSGNIKVIASKVGAANYIESLQEKAAQFKRPQSEIKKTINTIMIFSVVCVIVFGLFYTITYLLNVDSSKTYYSFVQELSGSLVSMIPAGMYLLTSLTLAVGVIVLARRRMLVQQLYCIEMLARVDTVCLDKTGTLTTGDMAVESIIPVSKLSKDEIEKLLKNLIYCTGDNNATSQALKNYLSDDGVYQVAKALPFDSSKKYSAVELIDHTCVAIGAYGFVNCIVDAKTEKLIQDKSREGYRVICIYTNKKPLKNNELPLLSKLVGIVLLSNSVKEDAPANIKWFQENGVNIKIISGDNPYTVSHIAEICGVIGFENLVNCENISNEELKNMANDKVVFGRVSPEQKELLINTLKSQGHTVAMTGDGVNDILALKAANCSVAMANGSSAARNVAHIVSLDSDFSKLPKVVEEGRRVINNLQRSCSLFLSKTIFAIVLSTIVSIMFFINKQKYPFTTNNMMIWEMISIGFASFFLALQPSKERLKGSFMNNILLRTLPSGIAEILAVISAYIIYKITPSYGSFETIAVLSFTLVSYVVLAKICYPFDLYRGLVLIGCVICGSILIILDWKMFNYGLLHIDYTNFSWVTVLIISGVVVLCSVIYFTLSYFIEKKIKKSLEAN